MTKKQDDYKLLQDELVQKVLLVVSSYYPVLEKVATLIAELDVLVAFSVVSCQASTMQWVRPKMLPEGNDLKIFDS